MLKEICDYNEYIIGIMTFCFSEEHQQKLIKVIESGVNDRNEICLWAISIGKNKDINKLKAKWL